jgi:hypothetical protein
MRVWTDNKHRANVRVHIKERQLLNTISDSKKKSKKCTLKREW